MARLATTIAAVTPLWLVLALTGNAEGQVLDSFAVLGASTVTNTGSTVIKGNVGVSPGSSITGFFPPGSVSMGTIHSNDGVAVTAHSELTSRFTALQNSPPSQTLTGQDLGGLTLNSGVYNFASSAGLTGTLTLDGQNNPNAVFIFTVGSSFTTASNAKINLINGAQGANVYFVVGSSATLGTGTDFQGRILADADITLTTSATIDCGAVWARTGAVTLDSNTINFCQVVRATASSVIGSDATGNEQAVAAAIDRYVAANSFDALPGGFQTVLSFLSPEQLRAGLSQLAGETATGVAPTAAQAMNSFLSLVVNPFDDDRGPNVVTTNPGPGGATVKTLGYVSDPPANRAGSVFASFDKPARAAADPKRWDIWASAFGGVSRTEGDAAVGSHDRTMQIYGFASGVDVRVAPATKVGFAFSAGGTNFGLAEHLGTGHSDTLQAAIYSRTNFHQAYLATALAYGWHDVSTDRYTTLVGTDRFSSAFTAQDVAAQIEAGYRIGFLVPYAAVRLQEIHTPAYSEKTVSGSSLFALDYDARSIATARTELGTRISQDVPLGGGASLQLRGRLAWAHDFWTSQSAGAAFQSLPGSNFVTDGAIGAADSVLVSAGAQLSLRSGLALAGWFDGAFADGSQTYTGTARLRYSW